MPKFSSADDLVSFAIKQVLPEWQRKLYTRYRDEIQVHSKGELFYKLDRLFPNEQPESKIQRILTFEPITKASFWKGVTNIIEIFQNSSYTAEASEKTVDFITEDNWDDKNLFSFFLDEWSRVALSEDANALCVVYPFDYIKEFPETIQVKFIGSEYIKYNKEGIVVYVSEDDSDKTFQIDQFLPIAFRERFYDPDIGGINFRHHNRTKAYSEKLIVKITRVTLHIFTEDGFYRVDQNKDDAEDWSWKFYANKNKFVAAVVTGGVQAERKSIHQSFFQGCVPMGNLALLQHSQHTAVNFTFSFPRMSELEGPCDFEGCNFGMVLCEKSTEFPEGKMPCPRCKGTQSISAQSPYKIYRRKYDPSGTGDNEHLKIPDVEYYTPDTAILKYSKDEWRDYLEQFEQALFITQPIKTGDIISAKSKEVDLKDKYSFLKRIAKVFYEKLKFVVQAYENYLNASPNQVSINTPFSFAIISEAEAFDALNNILKSDAPIIVKAHQIEMFISKFVSESSPIKKAFNVLKLVDKLLYYPIGDITILKSNLVVTADQWAIHTFAYPLLVEMYNDDPEFFDNDNDVIAKKLLTELDQYKVGQEPTLKDKIKTTLNGKFKQGDAVLIKPGSEQDPSHAGKTFTITGIALNSVTLTLDGSVITGYNITDITNV